VGYKQEIGEVVTYPEVFEDWLAKELAKRSGIRMSRVKLSMNRVR
jgi:hypothetical protein